MVRGLPAENVAVKVLHGSGAGQLLPRFDLRGAHGVARIGGQRAPHAQGLWRGQVPQGHGDRTAHARLAILCGALQPVFEVPQPASRQLGLSLRVETRSGWCADLSAQRRAEQGRSRAHGRGAHPAVAVRARSALQQLAGAHQVPAQPILVGQSLERPEREVRNFRFAIIERSEQQPHIQADRDTAQSLGRAQAHARVAMAQTGASGQFSGQARVGQLRQRQLRLVTDLGLFVGERAEHEAPSLRRSEGHQLFERALALVGALRPKFGGERLQRIAASARRVGRNERRRA
jgi:hypothetical protein